MPAVTQPRLQVDCTPANEGWSCRVRVLSGTSGSEHTVRVHLSDLDDLAPGATDPSGLVEESFGFLLEREPPQSILRDFDLPTISRYFPEYESEIRARMAGLP
jgi:hypothetical protein